MSGISGRTASTGQRGWTENRSILMALLGYRRLIALRRRIVTADEVKGIGFRFRPLEPSLSTTRI
jgi:hypothetical protein